jgi:protein gp37
VQDHLPWTTTPWPHVWLGVSVETQRYADERIPLLISTPAAHRFLSVEPLLGPVDLAPLLAGIDWVIIGGESGPDFRPMDLAWVDRIVGACEAVGVPVYMKQDSGPKSGQRARLSDALWSHKAVPA